MSFKSLYLDDNIRVAAKACTGTEHHVAEITAFLVKEPGYSVLPERRRMLVQEPLPFFVSKVVNVTNSFFPDIAAVIAAAHIVLMQIYESNRFAGATVLHGRAINFSYLHLPLQLRNSRLFSKWGLRLYQHLRLLQQTFTVFRQMQAE